MKRFAIRLMNDECGQDLIEYALLAGFISLASVLAHGCRHRAERGVGQR